jgi:type IV pilus assembly protein PilC
MARFAYVAVGADGQTFSGIEKAVNRSTAELTLYSRELRDIQVKEKKSFLQRELTGPRVKREELMHLSRQMAAFIRAGLPILDAVHTISEDTENSSVRRMMEDIEDGLRAGERFSDCLDRHAKVFPDYYRGIVRSAELTGQLDVVLARLAVYLERDLEARRKIKAATIYPGAIAGMSVVVVVVLSVYVLPKFKVFFASLDAKLPLPTRMLLAFTDFLSSYWWMLVAALVILVLGAAVAIRTQPGRHARDRLLLATPVVGTTIQFALVERFCRILASMVNAGVGLPEALRVATESLHNLVFTKSLSHVGEVMLEGEGLAGPLANTGLFPNTAAQMLRVGEDTGTLDTQLEVTAQYYEGELDYKIKRLTALFEPAVIIVMGVIVGFVAIALVSAMYGVFRQVKA